MPAIVSKVLVLGWDAADWKVIRPLLDAGHMPNLAGLIGRGASGNIATLYPVLSPTLWTSIATGKRPPKHGVLGFSEPTADGQGVRPCSILARKTKAIWNILAQAGKRSIVVGWWPSFPVEPIPGAVISNHFQRVPDDPDTPIPPLADSIVAPARIAAAQLEQLVALGYVSPLPDDRDKAVRETVRELDYNLARALADGGKPHEAIPILEKLWEEWPREHRFGSHLLVMYARMGSVADRRNALEKLRERAERFALEARDELAALDEADKAEKADKEKAAHAGNAEAADDPLAGESPAAKRRQFERRQLTELAAGLNLAAAETEQALLEGDLEAVAARIAPLLAKEAAGEQLGFAQASKLAEMLVELRRWNEALPIVERLLAADPETPSLASLRAEILFRRRDWEAVVEAAAEGLALIYFNPRLHLLLGLALARLGRRHDAINELLVTVRQNPSLVRGYDALERLHGHDPERALDYRRRAKELRSRILAARSQQAGDSSAAAPTTQALRYDFEPRCQAAPAGSPHAADEMVVVSGLPRSGTSMLMRVLEAGGLPVLADGRREADENNRLGYYEYEPVKGIAHGGARAWIAEGVGKAVKVVAPLVRHLPPEVPVRLLVLHRTLDQVLASQEAMKGRLGTAARGTAEGLASQFIAELDRVDQIAQARPGWQVLHVAYERMLADPVHECERIAGFLGTGFDAVAAATAVDPSQRRFGSGVR